MYQIRRLKYHDADEGSRYSKGAMGAMGARDKSGYVTESYGAKRWKKTKTHIE